MPRADLRGIRAGASILTVLHSVRYGKVVLEKCDTNAVIKKELKSRGGEQAFQGGTKPRGSLDSGSNAGATGAEFLPRLRYVSRGADISPIDTANSCALVQSLLRSRSASACS